MSSISVVRTLASEGRVSSRRVFGHIVREMKKEVKVCKIKKPPPVDGNGQQQRDEEDKDSKSKDVSKKSSNGTEKTAKDIIDDGGSREKRSTDSIISKSFDVNVSQRSSGETEGKPKETEGKPTTTVASPKSPVETERSMVPEEEFEVAVLARQEDSYGFGKYKFASLQFFGVYPSAFLVVLCFLAITASFLQHGAIESSYAMWQRRFRFSAMDIAITRAMYEVGAWSFAILVVFFGEGGVHRPRAIAVGGILVGLGALIMTLPHFISGKHRLDLASEYCTRNDPMNDFTPSYVQDDTSFAANDSIFTPSDTIVSTTTTKPSDPVECGKDKLVWGLVVIAIGEFLIGFGISIYYISGITFIDENASTRTSGVYTGILLFCHLLAVIPGRVITGQTNELSGDIDKGVSSLKYVDAKDKYHWYGAWWIPMLLGAFLSWLGSAVMMPYPRELSGTIVAKIRNAREAVMDWTQEDFDLELNEFRRRWLMLKHLFRNRVFLGAMFEECFRALMIAGTSAYVNRYIEAAFDVSSTFANMGTGLLVGFGILIGLCTGPLLQYLFNLEVRGNLRLCTIAALAALLFSTVYFVHCPKPNEKEEKPFSSEKKLIWDECAGCNCVLEKFDPYCFVPIDSSNPKRNYFSPCYAGCNDSEAAKTSNCTCLPQSMVNHEWQATGKLTKGYCTKCEKKAIAFMIGLAWLGGFSYVRANPNSQILLRSVNFKLRATALGLLYFCQRIITVPSPFLFATILHSACEIHFFRCNNKVETTCAVFNQQRLAIALAVMVFLCNLLCLGAAAFALYHYKDLKGDTISTKTAHEINTGDSSHPGSGEREKKKIPIEKP